MAAFRTTRCIDNSRASASNYLAELDVHFPELSLGETLTFASSARENSSAGGGASQATASDVAVLFGLSGAFDTKMGNALTRGVSGGEKRRTSIAEALITGSQLQCWDNSTRGLDSSSALQFIEMLRKSTTALESTAIMSIYQALEAMYHSSLLSAIFMSWASKSHPGDNVYARAGSI